jgi:AcrR family transcriptional regulator
MDDSAPKRGRGRPRRAGADAEILGVALALLREKGYREFTVDAVAERTGVAKTTIYRRWPTKAAVVKAAIEPAVATDPPPAELTALLTRLRELLTGELAPVIAALAQESDVDFLLPRQLFRDALANASGDRELLIDLAIGPFWTRLLVTHEELTETLPRQVVAALLR